MSTTLSKICNCGISTTSTVFCTVWTVGTCISGISTGFCTGHPWTTLWASGDDPLGHPETTLWPSVDDLGPSVDDPGPYADDHGPSADDHGPSASRRPCWEPGHPWTTTGHPQTTAGHPQTTSGHPHADDHSHPQNCSCGITIVFLIARITGVCLCTTTKDVDDPADGLTSVVSTVFSTTYTCETGGASKANDETNNGSVRSDSACRDEPGWRGFCR